MEDIKTHGGLFEGIGGFTLGAQRIGIKTLWAIENNPKKQQVFHQHFPEVKIYGDIRKQTHLPYCDILTGGFPCQDISVAGGQTGILGERSGLWAEFFRLIAEGKPKFVIIENSPHLLNKGLEYILYDLSKIGYDAQWTVLSCAQFGYRHLRNRLFLIAYTLQIGRQKRTHGIFRSLPPILRQTEVPGQTNLPMLLERIGRNTDLSLLRANNGISKGLDGNRLEAIGDAVCPDITEYLFNCIKQF